MRKHGHDRLIATDWGIGTPAFTEAALRQKIRREPCHLGYRHKSPSPGFHSLIALRNPAIISSRMHKFWWIGIFVLFWAIWSASTDAPDQPRSSRSAPVQSPLVDRPAAPVAAVAQPQPSPPAPGPAVAVDTATYGFVTGDRVRVRSGPGTSHSIIGHLNRGDRVRSVGQSGTWAEIVASVGRGWMSSEYLSLTPPAPRVATPGQPTRQVAAPTSREIQEARSAIISQSIASYPGSCPCPYNRDRGGRRCGARSAWSRPGGYSPICFDSDVTEARLQTYFARRR